MHDIKEQTQSFTDTHEDTGKYMDANGHIWRYTDRHRCTSTNTLYTRFRSFITLTSIKQILGNSKPVNIRPKL